MLHIDDALGARVLSAKPLASGGEPREALRGFAAADVSHLAADLSHGHFVRSDVSFVSALPKDGNLADMSMPPGGIPDPPEKQTEFQQAVVAVVSALERGDVVTYAEVAAEAGHPGAAQAVANVLRLVPDLPWWRVIPSSGRLYRTHRPTQEPLLRADGVAIDENGKVIVNTDRGDD